MRSTSKIEPIRAAPSIRKYLDKVEFVIVPDIIKDRAFDEAVKGVDYIIHCASPLALEVSHQPSIPNVTKKERD